MKRYFKEMRDNDCNEYNVWVVEGTVLVRTYVGNGKLLNLGWNNTPFAEEDIEDFGLIEVTEDELSAELFLEGV